MSTEKKTDFATSAEIAVQLENDLQLGGAEGRGPRRH